MALNREVQPDVGTRVAIHYDRHDPTTIVTDQSHVGRDVTLWIVAVKFVLGGANPDYDSVEHFYWMFLLGMIIIKGPGPISLDHLIRARLIRVPVSKS